MQPQPLPQQCIRRYADMHLHARMGAGYGLLGDEGDLNVLWEFGIADDDRDGSGLVDAESIRSKAFSNRSVTRKYGDGRLLSACAQREYES